MSATEHFGDAYYPTTEIWQDIIMHYDVQFTPEEIYELVIAFKILAGKPYIEGGASTRAATKLIADTRGNLRPAQMLEVLGQTNWVDRAV